MRVSRVIAGAVAAAAGVAVVRESRRRSNAIDLDGRAALVTGGSRGLGFVIARQLVREGCRVALVARDRAELEAAQAALESESGDVLSLVCDVSDPARVQEVVNTAVTHFGGLDLLVNNAGIIQVGPIESMTQDDFRLCLDVMFWGTLNMTLAAIPHFKQRGFGRVVNVTSIGGKVSAPHIAPYAAAKFAAVGLSEGLRAELAKDNVAVTTVVPGLVRTGSHVHAYFKGRREREFVWFSIADSLPLISMDAERAAKRVVLAARRGEAELTLGLPAKVGARFHGLFPGLTADVLGVVNRFLPSPSEGPTEMEMGLHAQQRLDSRTFELITALGQHAGRRFNEYASGSPTNGSSG